MTDYARLYWERVNDPGLRQGDLLLETIVPLIDASVLRGESELPLGIYNLAIISQSCDLTKESRLAYVVTAPIYTRRQYEQANPAYKKSGVWEEVRKGRHEGLYLLASPGNEMGDDDPILVVEFGHVFSLPRDYLEEHVRTVRARWRLNSPYLEHFSQAFAKFYMRVGLPVILPTKSPK